MIKQPTLLRRLASRTIQWGVMGALLLGGLPVHAEEQEGLTTGELAAAAGWNRGWNETDGHRFYVGFSGTILEHCWREIDGIWYYFDAPYALADTVQTIQGKTYRFLKDGAMYSGWYTDADGTAYYFKKKGDMAQKLWVQTGPDWYWLSEDGSRYSGWLIDEGETYFLHSDGTMARGTVTIGDTEYVFRRNGSLILPEDMAEVSGDYLQASDFLVTNSKVVTEEMFDEKVREFLRIPEYSQWAVWDGTTYSMRTSLPISHCGGYVCDLVHYVFGFDLSLDHDLDDPVLMEQFHPYTDEELASMDSIRKGDTVCFRYTLDEDPQSKTYTHIMMVLDKKGDRLWTAEGNAGGRVCISWRSYRIRDGIFDARGLYNEELVFGCHHFLDDVEDVQYD